MTDSNEELVDSIESAIKMTGRLFQRHPEHPEWDTARPGAEPGEIACFVRKVEGERKSYISVKWHDEGEQEPGTDYEWDSDGYEIVVTRGDGTSDRGVSTERRSAAEIIASYMEKISQ
jgi:hypothetical protein